MTNANQTYPRWFVWCVETIHPWSNGEWDHYVTERTRDRARQLAKQLEREPDVYKVRIRRRDPALI